MASLDKFKCAVCKDFYDNPCMLECNDVFCRECITRVFGRGPHAVRKNCPVCEEMVFGDNIRHAKEVLETMMKETVACVDCLQQVPLGRYKKHKPCLRRTDPTTEYRTTNVNKSCWKCPYCGDDNFDRGGLLFHCEKMHADDANQKRVCPICASMSWGDPDRESANLIGHLTLRHRYDMERVTDIEADEDAAIKEAMARSLREYEAEQRENGNLRYAEKEGE